MGMSIIEKSLADRRKFGKDFEGRVTKLGNQSIRVLVIALSPAYRIY